MGFVSQLFDIFDEGQIKKEEPLCLHTSLKIGGPADFFVRPNDPIQLSKLLLLCKQENVPWFLLGNGSNLCVSDRGFRGVVIKLWKSEKSIEEVAGHKEPSMGDPLTKEIIIPGGTLLSTASNEIARRSLKGFEFAAGIPGTLGGAVVMNAGAYGGEIKDHIVSAKVMDESGKISILSKDELALGYRSSALQGTKKIVLGASFSFPVGNKEEIFACMEDFNKRRKEKQPLEFPSAGSTFKRPEGFFAGKLIMDAGLSGFSIGGAEVSKKHCGFLINKGGASANDFFSLMHTVIDRVQQEFGVTLEPEIKFLGDFD